MLQMSKCLGHLEGVVCQVDDILVFGRNRTEHDERLKAVMEHLKTAGVTLNERKCEFAVDQVNYLGHVVSADGIKPDPDKGEGNPGDETTNGRHLSEESSWNGQLPQQVHTTLVIKNQAIA